MRKRGELVSKVGLERLKILADFLDKLPPKKFDIREWHSDIEMEEDEEELNLRVKNGVGECNTVACAWGWCPYVPQFKNKGLRLSRGWDGGVSVRYKDADGVHGAEEFFELAHPFAYAIFGGDEYYYSSKTKKHIIPNAKQVTVAIREFIDMVDRFNKQGNNLESLVLKSLADADYGFGDEFKLYV